MISPPSFSFASSAVEALTVRSEKQKANPIGKDRIPLPVTKVLLLHNTPGALDSVIPSLFARELAAVGGAGAFQVERFECRSERTIEPEWASKAVGAGSWPRLGEPTFVNFVRFGGIDENIAILVGILGLADADFLVPTVHAANRVGMHSMSEILRHAAVAPPQAG